MSRHRRLRPVSRLALVASVLVAMLSTLATALAAPVTPARTAPVPSRSVAPRPAEPPRRRPRHAAPDPAPQPQARPIPRRIPDYAAFAACAEQYSALWEITYEYGDPRPYTARNRVTGTTIATDDLGLFDHILGTYEPPHPVRGYYGQQVVGGGA